MFLVATHTSRAHLAARLERLLTKEAAVGPDTCHLFGKKVSGGRVLHPNVGAITPAKRLLCVRVVYGHMGQSCV